MEWIPLLSIPIKTFPGSIFSPVIILSISTNPIPVPAKSKSFIISGSEAVSPPIIAIFDSIAPLTRPSAIFEAFWGSGFSTAR